jgi:hypothetical protein
MGGNRQPDRRETVILDSINHLQGGDIAGVSPGVLARLTEHGYPGNVRELENITIADCNLVREGGGPAPAALSRLSCCRATSCHPVWRGIIALARRLLLSLLSMWPGRQRLTALLERSGADWSPVQLLLESGLSIETEHEGDTCCPRRFSARGNA